MTYHLGVKSDVFKLNYLNGKGRSKMWDSHPFSLKWNSFFMSWLAQLLLGSNIWLIGSNYVGRKKRYWLHIIFGRRQNKYCSSEFWRVFGIYIIWEWSRGALFKIYSMMISGCKHQSCSLVRDWKRNVEMALYLLRNLCI